LGTVCVCQCPFDQSLNPWSVVRADIECTEPGRTRPVQITGANGRVAKNLQRARRSWRELRCLPRKMYGRAGVAPQQQQLGELE
jgi:hypothetical protein